MSTHTHHPSIVLSPYASGLRSISAYPSTADTRGGTDADDTAHKDEDDDDDDEDGEANWSSALAFGSGAGAQPHMGATSTPPMHVSPSPIGRCCVAPMSQHNNTAGCAL